MTLQSLSPMWPELIIAGAAMVLLMLGVFRPDTENNGEMVGWLAILALIVAAVVVLQQPAEARTLFQHRLRLCFVVAAFPFLFFFLSSVVGFIDLFGKNVVGW